MTSTEYDKLTDIEKRIKVAELCGVAVSYDDNGGLVIDEVLRDVEHIPDYLNDLNACHEFEKGLGDKLLSYYWTLHRQLGTPQLRGEIALMSATAEQRCKAFVLTMEGT